MYDENTLVTVIVIAENSPEEHIFAAIKNVLDQTHKNTDIIVSSLKDNSSIKERCKSLSLNIRFIQTDANISLFNDNY